MSRDRTPPLDATSPYSALRVNPWSTMEEITLAFQQLQFLYEKVRFS